ncbi:MAG: chloride channel protein [Lachnospiraceae bacterium]|nr:chloride channel protein [Lachnospiraceae bacterium]
MQRFCKTLITLFKWTVLAGIAGGLIGVLTSGFAFAIAFVTEFRLEHMWMLIGLPFAGLLIVFLYRIAGRADDKGTNTVIVAVREKKEIPLVVGPLIFVSTVLTHAFGGSTGREGAALQLGGSIGDFAARHLKLGSSDRRILIMCSMSAAFSALFGTPLAAAILPMEFVNIGMVYYAALVPCVLSSLAAHAVSVQLHVHALTIPYEVEKVPQLYSMALTKAILMGICCALAGILFVNCLHYSGQLFKRKIANPYIRVAFGGCLVAALAFILRTQDYIGLGENVMAAAFEGKAVWYAFLLKILFTCLTLETGFKGGEIVPSFFVGATMGCFLSGGLGLPAELCAACGMCGVFCAITNSPFTSMIIAMELFGQTGMGFFFIVIAISYMLSDYYSVFSAQKFMYSKTETKLIEILSGDTFHREKK